MTDKDFSKRTVMENESQKLDSETKKAIIRGFKVP